MTGRISRNGTSRSMKVILAAVFAVALMLAVPLMVTADSDAALIENEAGYSVELVNPTDEEISTYGAYSKELDIRKASSYFAMIFDMTSFDSPEITAQSYTSLYAIGIKQDSESLKQINVEKMDADGVVMKYTATDNGELIYDNPAYDDDYKEIVKAVKTYLGNEVSIGDVLKITGHIEYEDAIEEDIDLAKVRDGVNVVDKSENTRFIVTDMDVTIEFTHAGSTKSIKFTSDYKFTMNVEVTYDYEGVNYSDLTDSSPCTVKYGAQKYEFQSGSFCYTVDGEDYKAEYYLTPSNDYDTTADLITDNELNMILTGLMVDAGDFPADTDRVTVERTYADAESVFDNVAFHVVGNDLLKIILVFVGIVIAVLILIIIIVVVLIVLRKKRKQA